MKQITITVSDAAGTGKSRTISALGVFLIQHGYGSCGGKYRNYNFYQTTNDTLISLREVQTPGPTGPLGTSPCPPGWNERTRASNLLGAAAEQAKGLGQSLKDIQGLLQALPLDLWSTGGGDANR